MKNIKFSYYQLVVFGIICFIIINNWIFKPHNILSWDVFGYYLYLPLQFIYNDLGLKNISIVNSIIEKYNNTATFYQGVQMPEGNYVMKYSAGMAVLYSPFFALGHLFAIILNYPCDGFSLPYQYSIFIGSIFYSIIGIYFLSKILLEFFSRRIAAITLLLLVFGTNYIAHITMYGQNAMSHNYLFTSYTIIIWYSICWHKTYKLKHAIILAFASGFTILSRPSEIVCLGIPLFWGIFNKESFIEKIRTLKEKLNQLVIFTIILLLIGSIQFIYWKIQTGKFLYNSYGGNPGEGFEFFHPFITELLFSFRKGWFIYTPIMFLALFGFIIIFKLRKDIFYTFFLFFIANIYIVSSWSCWWYAQSFSQRSVIQMYPIMAIILGFLIHWILDQKIIIRNLLLIFLSLFVFLNIFQSIQFHKGIIHGDRMTYSYYIKTFGKLNVNEEDKKLLLINRSFDGSESFENKQDYSLKSKVSYDFENDNKASTKKSYSGKKSILLDSSNIYSPTIEIPFKNITQKDHAWIKVSAKVFSEQAFTENPFSLVIQFNQKEYAFKYKNFDSESMNLNVNKWQTISYYYLTPEVRNINNYLKTYIWYRGKTQMYVDDFQVEIFEKKN